MVIALIAVVLVLALATLPQMWVRRVIEAHAADRQDFPGTGAEFARHLLDHLNLPSVQVEETADGDHYDPETKTVRLLPDHYRGRSLSAVVIAAHEVGHAVQDAAGYPALQARTRLARHAIRLQQIGSVMMLVSPLALILFKTPAIIIVELLMGLLVMAASILMHAVTLPVEFDASFRRALPILKEGGYLQARDIPAARSILRAAAFTYVAAAALQLVDIARWLRVLRF